MGSVQYGTGAGSTSLVSFISHTARLSAASLQCILGLGHSASFTYPFYAAEVFRLRCTCHSVSASNDPFRSILFCGVLVLEFQKDSIFGRGKAGFCLKFVPTVPFFFLE